jgi:ankyrin repeat protein
VDVVRELITRGCPVDITDNEGRTPLHDAACSGQPEVVLELIKNGAERN